MYKITSYKYIDNNKKDSVFYLHGWGCNLKYMVPLTKTKKWNCLVLDLPGFGENLAFEKPFLFEEIADCIINFINENNYNISYIVGHSFGGKLATYISSKLHIKHLFLLSASIFNKKRHLSYYIKIYFYKLIKVLFPKSKLLLCFGSKDYKQLNGVMKKTMSNVINYKMNKTLKLLNIPTSIIFAKNDNITPMYLAKKIKRKIKDSSIIKINGDHFSNLYNIDYINLIIESVVNNNV